MVSIRDDSALPSLVKPESTCTSSSKVISAIQSCGRFWAMNDKAAVLAASMASLDDMLPEVSMANTIPMR